MKQTEKTSPEGFDDHVPGTLVASSRKLSWRELFVQVFTRNPVQDTIVLPAVPEPLIVFILSGTALVEERELQGKWLANRVAAGDFFLTNSPRPTELRWHTLSPEPFRVMHLYLGLPLVRRAVKDVYGAEMPDAGLREISGQRDPLLCTLLEQLLAEFTAARGPSRLFVHGIVQSLAVHVVRHYSDPQQRRSTPRGGLPAYKLQRVVDLLQASLHEEFSLQRLAQEAGLSEFHFCRAFKHSTGTSPTRYLIHLRMALAKKLLRESDRSVLDVGLEVGYTSPSHFAQVFRREIGVTPSDYRRSL